MLRKITPQTVGDITRDHFTVERIEIVMRIALGMDIAFGAVDSFVGTSSTLIPTEQST